MTRRGGSVLELTPDEMRVIYERHHGWEKASYELLSAIFGVDRRVIGQICRDHSNAPHTNSRDLSCDPAGQGSAPL